MIILAHWRARTRIPLVCAYTPWVWVCVFYHFHSKKFCVTRLSTIEYNQMSYVRSHWRMCSCIVCNNNNMNQMLADWNWLILLLPQHSCIWVCECVCARSIVYSPVLLGKNRLSIHCDFHCLRMKFTFCETVPIRMFIIGTNSFQDKQISFIGQSV